MSALTPKQRDLLDFIKAYAAAKETAPSFDEMREALGLKSKSGIHRLVGALEERGFIRRLVNRARAIEILPDPRLPDSAVLSAVRTADLACEAKRRGLVLGEWHRTTSRVGSTERTLRRFVEVAR